MFVRIGVMSGFCGNFAPAHRPASNSWAGFFNDHILENKKNRMSGPPKVVTFNRFGGIRFLAELLQDVQAGAKINVIRLTVQHEGGDGFDARALSFGHPLLGLPEVDDLHLEARGIECGGEVLFSGHTDGTTGVIELGFSFHVRFVFWFVFCGVMAQAMCRRMKFTEVLPE